jgi:hypothetical protein
MKAYIGEVNNKQGIQFENEVFDYCSSNVGFEVDKRVEIKPSGKFKHDKNLGDVDVLIVDKNKKRILLLECKNVNFGRNQREIANELQRFTAGDNNWIGKTQVREEWLKSNYDQVKQAYNLGDEKFEFKTVFIITTEIPTKYLIEDDKTTFITFGNMKSSGIQNL